MNEMHQRSIDNWNYVAQHPDDDFVISKMDCENFPTYMYLFRPREIQTMLDFGCGVGRNFIHYRDVSKILHGYDLPTMIKRCRNMTQDIYADKLLDNWNDVNSGIKYDIVSACYVFQFFGCVKELKKYLIDISNISYYFYFTGKVTMDDGNRTDIIQIISELDVFEPIYYTPEEKGHLQALFKSKQNNTHRPILEVNTNQKSYLTKWIHIEEPEINPTKPNLLLTVATDGFDQVLELTEQSLINYSNKINADYIKISKSTQDWWGLEKFGIGSYANYYDRVVFIDADIFIRDNSPNILEIVPIDQFGIYEEKKDLELTRQEIFIRDYRAMCRFLNKEPYDRKFFNTGVMVFNQKHKEVFQAPTTFFKCYHCAEQDLVENNLIKGKYSIYSLPKTLNCQHWTHSFKREEKDAYFIHFSGLSIEMRKKEFNKYVLRK
jgi:hypothetical protein